MASPNIFRFPKVTPRLTYDGIAEYIEKGVDGRERKVGTTVQLEKHEGEGGPFVDVMLYGTTIATIYPTGHLEVWGNVDRNPTHATTMWLQRVMDDNGVDITVSRIGGKYPVAGRVYKGRKR